MKKLRILIICDRGYIVGGTETNILRQSYELEKRGHLVKILTSDYNPADKQLYSNYTFRGYRENGLVKWILQIFNPISLVETIKAVKEFKPDVIYLHNIFYQASPSILLATKGIPTVMVISSYEVICPTGAIVKPDGSRCVTPGKHDLRCTGSIKGYIYEKIKQEIHRILLKNVTIYIAPSESIKRDLTDQKIISSPIKVIYNGIEPTKYEPIRNYNRILYVGRLSKEKGVEVLLRAAKKIKETFPDIMVDIVGDGPETEHLKSLSKSLNLQNTVSFVGKIEKDEVINYYKNCTFLVVPSICPESFSLVGIEALHIGRPVVGSNLGAIPEWLKDNKCGFLFEPLNDNDLYNKSLILLGNKGLLDKMSEYCYEYSSNFTLEININNLLDLFSTLIK